MLDLAEVFEREFVNQETKRRTVHETLDAGISLLKRFGVAVE
jgi:vacuolar-type H+-ATPase subunit B/Vma2